MKRQKGVADLVIVGIVVGVTMLNIASREGYQKAEAAQKKSQAPAVDRPLIVTNAISAGNLEVTSSRDYGAIPVTSGRPQGTANIERK